MIKNFKFILSLILVLSFISGCGTVKEGFVGTKQKNSDEFLIEKKNPLVLPPDYSELPVPKKKNNSQKAIVNDENIDLSEILKKSDKKKTISGNGDIEKSISEIIESE